MPNFGGQRHVHLPPDDRLDCGSAAPASRSANYTQTATLTGHGCRSSARFSVPLYALSAAAVPPGGGKTAHEPRRAITSAIIGLRSQRHQAPVEPLDGAASAFSTNDWREYFDDPTRSILDPTRAPAPSPAWPFAGPQVDGGLVVAISRPAAARAASTWSRRGTSSSPTACTRRPGASTSARNLVTRQGYAEPFFQSNVPTGDPLGQQDRAARERTSTTSACRR